MHRLRCAGMLIAVISLWMATAAAALAADFPTGTFTQQAPDGATWALNFDGKGKLVVTAAGQPAVEGTYRVTKDQVEFRDVKGPHADANAGPGTYRWKLDGKRLTFVRIKDEHQGRAQALTSGAWVRKE